MEQGAGMTTEIRKVSCGCTLTIGPDDSFTFQACKGTFSECLTTDLWDMSGDGPLKVLWDWLGECELERASEEQPPLDPEKGHV